MLLRCFVIAATCVMAPTFTTAWKRLSLCPVASKLSSAESPTDYNLVSLLLAGQACLPLLLLPLPLLLLLLRLLLLRLLFSSSSSSAMTTTVAGAAGHAEAAARGGRVT